MKNLLKNLLPAMALTLLVAGTITASAFTTAKTQKVETLYWGLPQTGGPISLGENEPNPITDCDETENPCYYRVVDGGDPEYVQGGFYKTQP